MYKIASENAARRAGHIKMADALGPVTFTAQEQYDNARQLYKKLQNEIEKMPRSPEREEKVKRLVVLQETCRDLKKKIGIVRHGNLTECIATQAKLICPPALWECILNAAKAEWEEIEKRKNQPVAPVIDPNDQHDCD